MFTDINILLRFDSSMIDVIRFSDFNSIDPFHLRKQFFFFLALSATPEIRCCRKCQLKRLGKIVKPDDVLRDTRKSVPTEISCFPIIMAKSLLYYLEIERNHRKK